MLYLPTWRRTLENEYRWLLWCFAVEATRYPGYDFHFRPLTVGSQYTTPNGTLHQIVDIQYAPKSSKITAIRLAPVDGATMGHYYTLSHFDNLVHQGRLVRAK